MALPRPVVFLVGLITGAGAMWAWLPHGEDAAPTEAKPASSRPTPKATPAPRADAPPDVAALKAQIQVQQALYDSLVAATFGTPIAWPAATPHDHTEAGFRAVLDRALSQCETHLQLRDVDCAEPPCMAMLVGDGQAPLRPTLPECAPWVEAFGPDADGANARVDCGDGRKESVYVLSPSWTYLEDPDDRVERVNLAARERDRQNTTLQSWKCAGL